MSVHTMETLALFDSAPYQNAFSARVIAVSEQGIALEHTLFYPTGGGQPGDTGHFIPMAAVSTSPAPCATRCCARSSGTRWNTAPNNWRPGCKWTPAWIGSAATST